MSEQREKYAAVNGQWPEPMPDLHPEEALAAAKRLYRFAAGKAWKGKWALTSGRRYTWPRSGVYYVNPARTNGWSGRDIGWRDLVHMMSHYVNQRLHPTWKPHGPEHHAIERRMVAYVIEQGWLDGSLRKPAKPKPDRVAKKKEATAAALKRWEAKKKRAETALRKLKRRATYYGIGA